jgi:tetratricopeptide (TPR) repeat protein
MCMTRQVGGSQAPDPAREAVALADLGDVQHLMGELPSAIASLRESAALSRRTAQPTGEARALTLFAMTLRLIREYESAVQAATRAVAIYRAAGDRDGEASALIQLAAAQYDTGDYATATANLTVALEACRARQPVRRSQRPGPPRLGPAPRRRLPGRARQLGTHPGAIA